MKVFIYCFVLLALLATALAVSECPAEDGEIVVHLPNSADCSTFYKCLEGTAYLLNCPTGLEWNAKYEVCDWPENAGCVVEEK